MHIHICAYMYIWGFPFGHPAPEAGLGPPPRRWENWPMETHLTPAKASCARFGLPWGGIFPCWSSLEVHVVQPELLHWLILVKNTRWNAWFHFSTEDGKLDILGPYKTNSVWFGLPKVATNHVQPQRVPGIHLFVIFPPTTEGISSNRKASYIYILEWNI